MAKHLHDPAVRADIRSRVQSLTPNSTRGWGKMSVDQMLWHCNAALDFTVGRGEDTAIAIPLPKFVLRLMILNMPWPKGARTYPAWIAGDRYDFEVEKARCLSLIDEMTAKPLDSAWPKSPALGNMSGEDWSRLQAKHLEHHLRQFGA